MAKKIVIEKNPLITLVRSAYEVYNRETYGYLFGEFDKRNDTYIVKLAHPSQKAKLKFTELYLPNDKYKKRIDFLNDMIGDYHSHTTHKKNKKRIKGDGCLSDDDIGFLRENKEFISLVVVINETNKTNNLIIKDDYVAGTLVNNGDKYRIELYGYYFDKKLNRAIRADMDVERCVLKSIF